MNSESKLGRVWALYRDGFRSMTVGRTLWILIAVKLFIMFAILKVFFFPGFLRQYDEKDGGRENYVREQLIERTGDTPTKQAQPTDTQPTDLQH